MRDKFYLTIPDKFDNDMGRRHTSINKTNYVLATIQLQGMRTTYLSYMSSNEPRQFKNFSKAFFPQMPGLKGGGSQQVDIAG